MKSCWFIISAALLLAFTSCAPQIPFTQSVRHEYKLTVDELQSIQFYTSQDIVLEKNQQNIREKSTESGTLAVKNGTSVERVIIPAGTPCVVNKVIDGQRLALQFGNNPLEYLVFGTIAQGGQYYSLQTLRDNQGRPVVTYKNETYLLRAAPRDILLLFQMKGIREYQQKQKVVKGKRL